MVQEMIDFLTASYPEIGASVAAELARQRRNIELIASENIVSEAVLVAMFGELLNQIISPYGITATTLLWVIPPMIQAAIIGVVALRAQAAGKRMENRPVMCYTVSILAAIVTTAANTAVIWLDSVIYGYYTFALVFGSAMIRFVTGVVAAVLVATVAMPLTILLRRQKSLLS